MLARLFGLSLFVIAFTYAGYPLLLALWARMSPKAVLRLRHHPGLTVVIVAHDEEVGIGAKIDQCLDQDYPVDRLRVLAVSDGSMDATAAVIESMAERDPRVGVMVFPVRRGKAACLNDALANCVDEIVVFCDVRQQIDRDAIRFLVEPLSDEDVGAVSGELAFRTDSTSGFAAGVDAYWRYEKYIRRQEAVIDSVVGVTGAFYAMRRSLWQPIPPTTILDDVLVPMNVVLQGKRVLFETRAIAWDRPSESSQQERPRKVRTLAGNFQLLALRPELLSPRRNPIFVQFFCHKVLRLLVPLFMTSALLCNALLATRSLHWAIVLLAQIALYGLAAAGPRHPRLALLKPVRLLSTFLWMNAFVVLGFFDFLNNKDAHLWRKPPTPE